MSVRMESLNTLEDDFYHAALKKNTFRDDWPITHKYVLNALAYTYKCDWPYVSWMMNRKFPDIRKRMPDWFTPETCELQYIYILEEYFDECFTAEGTISQQMVKDKVAKALRESDPDHALGKGEEYLLRMEHYYNNYRNPDIDEEEREKWKGELRIFFREHEISMMREEEKYRQHPILKAAFERGEDIGELKRKMEEEFEAKLKQHLEEEDKATEERTASRGIFKGKRRRLESEIAEPSIDKPVEVAGSSEDVVCSSGEVVEETRISVVYDELEDENEMGIHTTEDNGALESAPLLSNLLDSSNALTAVATSTANVAFDALISVPLPPAGKKVKIPGKEMEEAKVLDEQKGLVEEKAEEWVSCEDKVLEEDGKETEKTSEDWKVKNPLEDERKGENALEDNSGKATKMVEDVETSSSNAVMVVDLTEEMDATDDIVDLTDEILPAATVAKNIERGKADQKKVEKGRAFEQKAAKRNVEREGDSQRSKMFARSNIASSGPCDDNVICISDDDVASEEVVEPPKLEIFENQLCLATEEAWDEIQRANPIVEEEEEEEEEERLKLVEKDVSVEIREEVVGIAEEIGSIGEMETTTVETEETGYVSDIPAEELLFAENLNLAGEENVAVEVLDELEAMVEISEAVIEEVTMEEGEISKPVERVKLPENEADVSVEEVEIPVQEEVKIPVQEKVETPVEKTEIPVEEMEVPPVEEEVEMSVRKATSVSTDVEKIEKVVIAEMKPTAEIVPEGKEKEAVQEVAAAAVEIPPGEKTSKEEEVAWKGVEVKKEPIGEPERLELLEIEEDEDVTEEEGSNVKIQKKRSRHSRSSGARKGKYRKRPANKSNEAEAKMSKKPAAAPKPKLSYLESVHEEVYPLLYKGLLEELFDSEEFFARMKELEEDIKEERIFYLKEYMPRIYHLLWNALKDELCKKNSFVQLCIYAMLSKVNDHFQILNRVTVKMEEIPMKNIEFAFNKCDLKSRSLRPRHSGIEAIKEAIKYEDMMSGGTARVSVAQKRGNASLGTPPPSKRLRRQ